MAQVNVIGTDGVYYATNSDAMSIETITQTQAEDIEYVINKYSKTYVGTVVYEYTGYFYKKDYADKNITNIKIRAVGGGGGGGGAVATAVSSAVGTSGAAGNYVESDFISINDLPDICVAYIGQGGDPYIADTGISAGNGAYVLFGHTNIVNETPEVILVKASGGIGGQNLSGGTWVRAVSNNVIYAEDGGTHLALCVPGQAGGAFNNDTHVNSSPGFNPTSNYIYRSNLCPYSSTSTQLAGIDAPFPGCGGGGATNQQNQSLEASGGYGAPGIVFVDLYA